MPKPVKGELFQISKEFDTNTYKYWFLLSIDVGEQPDLMLGPCEIVQK